MADESVTVINSSGNTGTDYDVAVDTVAGKKYQRVKLDAGADGAVQPIVAGQQLAAASIPVVLASDENDVTVTGTVTANAGTNLNTSALATESGGNLDTIAGDTTSLDAKITACDTGSVTVASSALPSGAATAANQATANTSLSNLETDASTAAAGFAAEGAALGSGVLLQGDDGVDRKNINVDATTGDVQVDITNTVTVGDISGTVSLPTGAATAANQSTANTSLSSIDTDTTTIAGDTTSLDTKVTACDTGNVTVASSALPTGAATSALQTTGNTSLSTIAGDTTSLDTKVTTCDTDDVRQTTHDNLNANANIQVGNTDVSDTNAVPTSVRRSSTTTLINGTVFNNTTTTETSSAVDCRDYRTAFLTVNLAESGAPTKIQLMVEGSLEDTDYFDKGDGYHNHLTISEAAIGSGLTKYYIVENLPPYVKLTATATGTTASDTITLTAKWAMMD